MLDFLARDEEIAWGTPSAQPSTGRTTWCSLKSGPRWPTRDWHPHRDRPQGHDEGENGCRTGTARHPRSRPPLALAALQAEPSIGLLLPCNVVVRSADEQTTVVEAVDPQTMVAMTANPALQTVADDATSRLTAALDSLTSPPTEEE